MNPYAPIDRHLQALLAFASVLASAIVFGTVLALFDIEPAAVPAAADAGEHSTVEMRCARADDPIASCPRAVRETP